MFLTGFVVARVKSTTTLLSSGETFKKFGEFQVPRMLYLSKGCGCEVVLFLWFCCYLLLTAGQITEPTEGLFLFHPFFCWYSMLCTPFFYDCGSSSYSIGEYFLLDLIGVITYITKWNLSISSFVSMYIIMQSIVNKAISKIWKYCIYVL